MQLQRVLEVGQAEDTEEPGEQELTDSIKHKRVQSQRESRSNLKGLLVTWDLLTFGITKIFRRQVQNVAQR
jgi:hypothetical protein